MKRILLIALFSIAALNLANAQGKSQEKQKAKEVREKSKEVEDEVKE